MPDDPFEALHHEHDYLRIAPTTDPIDPTLVTTALTELHAAASPDTRGRLRKLLGRQPTPDTVEVLLAATGTPGPDGDRALQYYVGVEPAALDAIIPVVRRLFPTSYEITTCTRSYAAMLGAPAPAPTPGAADEDPAEELDALTDADTMDADTDPGSPMVAGLEVQAVARKPDDWQTRLTPIERYVGETTANSRLPLARVAETLADAAAPALVQTLLRPKPDWSADAHERRKELEHQTDNWWDTIEQSVFGSDPSTVADTGSTEGLRGYNSERLEDVRAKDPRHSFSVNVRAVALGTDGTHAPASVLDRLARAYRSLGGRYYDLLARQYDPDSRAATRLLEALSSRQLRSTPGWGRRFLNRLPVGRHRAPAIVADPDEAAALVLLGGDDLPAAADRALGTTPTSRQSIQLPANQVLDRYLDTAGMPLVRPVTADGTTLDTTVRLPPDLQPLHTAIFGPTGAGKTLLSVKAQSQNAAATDGADVVITPKGDGTAIQYLRTHYAREGSLEGVYYFDCAETLPALSVFDIRPQLEAGIDREQAVENVVGHYTEILAGFMGRQRYEQAVRSPDIIHYLVKALFDPVHGADAFSHRDLKRATSRMHETRDAPPVSDPDLRADLQGVAANSKRSFDELMQGVANRIEKATRDRRLATLFNHVADAPQEAQPSPTADGGTTDDTDGGDPGLFDDDTAAADTEPAAGRTPAHGTEPPDTPRFDFGTHLDEDCLIVLDTSGYRPDAQRMLTLVLLSKLWTALKRRAASTPPDQDVPLVNCIVEEAADVAPAGVLADMLSKGRSLGLGVTLSMQFPRQIREDHPQVFWELLNDVETVVTGPVGVAPKLAERMATADRPADEVGNRLRALDRGEWLVRLAAPFDEEAPPPFKGQSPPLPAGHPDGPHPFDTHEQDRFEAAQTRVKGTTRSYHGLDVTGDGTSEASDGADHDRPTAALDDTDAPPVDRTLAYTQRLPNCIHYDSRADAIVCDSCDTRYGTGTHDLRRAIACCHDFGSIDRDDIPVCSVDLTLTPAEREGSDYDDRQLVFLQTVYDAHQGHFDRQLEYDIRWDSMVRLQEYTGIDREGVDELLADGLLAHDWDYPHRLYTVTADGRDAIAVGHREGIAHGHGAGDLSESSGHVMMVELGVDLVTHQFVDDDASAAVEARKYYEADGHRYDVVGLDDDGNIVVTVEAERSNHDTRRAVPDDYDKMAAHDPEAAIWIVKNGEAAHDVLDALNDPPEGEPRVEKSYSDSVQPQRFNIDTPGLTDVYTVRYVRDSVLELDPPSVDDT